MSITSTLRKLGGKVPGSRKILGFLLKFLPSSIKINFSGVELYINPRDTRNFIDAFFPLDDSNNWYKVLSSVINKGDCIIDVGGNIGLTAIIASKCTQESGEVIVFEPEPDCFRLLKKNIRLHGINNIYAHKLALSDRDGVISFYKDKKYSILGSLSKNNIMNNTEEIVVQTSKYDSFIKTSKKIHILKMNIQGSEGMVIEGARQMIKQHLPMVISEFWPLGLKNMNYHPKDFIKYFKDLGYERYLVDHDGNVLNISESRITQKIDSKEEDIFSMHLLFQHKKGSKYVNF